MDNCAYCKYAICDVVTGYSSKECGMPSGSMTVVEDCRKESDAFFQGGKDCEYFKEYEDD